LVDLFLILAVYRGRWRKNHEAISVKK
jgi:hypothetical protein